MDQNASRKSTLLDVLGLLSDVLRDGVAAAIRRRSPPLESLLWMGEGQRFEVAVELEILEDRRGRKNPFHLGPQRLALADLPEDEERFPVATWAKRLLPKGVHILVLNGEAMRRPAPPGSPTASQAARLLRRTDQLGSLAAGKNADLLVLRKDPTQDLSTLREPELVIHDGRIVVRAALARIPPQPGALKDWQPPPPPAHPAGGH